MNQLAQEIGAMDLDDPTRASLVKELSDLTQLIDGLKARGNQSIGERMDELAREMATLKPGDPRDADCPRRNAAQRFVEKT